MSDDLRSRVARVPDAESHSGLASWYDEACQDLAEIHLEAAEDGFDAPKPTTIQAARTMLKLLAEEYDQLPYVEAIRDGRIGITFGNRPSDSRILLVIESDRTGLLIARVNGASYRKRVPDVFKILSLGGRQALDEAGIRRRPPQPADASSPGH